LGFGLLEKELSDPSVDALLFQRVNVDTDSPERWIAVINLQETEARGYWNRPHELVHRLAEPPQQRLPFFRHRSDVENRIERIIDLGAAELAFPRIAFAPHVERVNRQELTWDLVRAVRGRFAPTSSLLSAAKAFLRYWPQPAFLLAAQVRGRKRQPTESIALRVSLEGYSPSAASCGVRFFPNMRVPASSPIMRAHETRGGVTDHENLLDWTTSGGTSLPDCRALTSGIRLRDVTYGLVSLT
jgi:hypothetical protein